MSSADALAIHVTVVHGPNLNLLGTREPERYGRDTLAEVDAALVARAQELGVTLASVQSNSEGALVDVIQAERLHTHGYLVNAAGYTHTSVAIRDALLATSRPFVEVHLTNPHAREPFRHRSLLTDVAVGCVSGFGPRSYLLGLEGLVDILRRA